jgi:hypothetical protein
MKGDIPDMQAFRSRLLRIGVLTLLPDRANHYDERIESFAEEKDGKLETKNDLIFREQGHIYTK